MPKDKIFKEFKEGKLHSGSKNGPKVTNRKQAVAIAMSYPKEGKKDGGKITRRGNRSLPGQHAQAVSKPTGGFSVQPGFLGK